VIGTGRREGVVWNIGNVIDKVTSFYASTMMVSPWTSFCAGALTASLVWYGFHRASSLVRKEEEEEVTSKKAGKSKQGKKTKDGSFKFSILLGLSSSISQHIGELPSKDKMMRWPWDRLRHDDNDDNDNDNNNNNDDDESIHSSTHSKESSNSKESDSASKESEGESKSGLCIGSIFGMDVGGTLAKLVYFEQESRELSLHQRGERIEHYHQALSAQVVLRARRGSSSSSSSSVSKTTCNHSTRMSAVVVPLEHSSASEQDLQGMIHLRQKSVPDNLATFGQEAHRMDHHRSDNLTWMAGSPEPLPGASLSPPSAPLRCRTEPKPQPSSSDGSPTLKRSHSMFDMLHTPEHEEALSRFYNFARRLDAYQTGVKDKHLSFYSRYLGGEFHFMSFETRHMTSAMDLIRVNDLHLNIRQMGATGGGAHKYADEWYKLLGILIQREDELDSLVAGLQFVMEDVPGECYTFKPTLETDCTDTSTDHSTKHDEPPPPQSHDDNTQQAPPPPLPSSSMYHIDQWTHKVQRNIAAEYKNNDNTTNNNNNNNGGLYPYLLVTIGTGVSILRVDGPRKHERVSGSTIGGGTYWGICRLLTTAKDFQEVLNLAERGDPSKVDMMVGDIYGQNSDALEKLGLPANIVASSFGKLVAKPNPAEGLGEEDLAHAILLMVTNNIGQVAYLNATLHHTKRIFFVGNFLRHNLISQRRLSYAINYWSKGNMEALFLEHEGYFGALGAFLLSQGITHEDYSGGGGGTKHESGKNSTKDSSGTNTREYKESHYDRKKNDDSCDVNENDVHHHTHHHHHHHQRRQMQQSQEDEEKKYEGLPLIPI